MTSASHPALRHGVPGGHSPKDGGYRMLEPSEEERQNLAARVTFATAALNEQLRAAERLIAAYGLARHVSNGVLANAVREAEVAYDTAKLTAQHALYPVTRPAEVRASDPNPHIQEG